MFLCVWACANPFLYSGGATITTHARRVPDSVRRPDDKRKKARESRKERKAEEAVKRQEELKRLKNLKKQEIMEKIKKIHGMAGVSLDEIPTFKKGGDDDDDDDDPSKVVIPGPFDENDIDGDFDPEKYDRKMNQVFGNEYYGHEEVCHLQLTHHCVYRKSYLKSPSLVTTLTYQI